MHAVHTPFRGMMLAKWGTRAHKTCGFPYAYRGKQVSDS
jgi:hypothetical protein